MTDGSGSVLRHASVSGVHNKSRDTVASSLAVAERLRDVLCRWLSHSRSLKVIRNDIIR